MLGKKGKAWQDKARHGKARKVKTRLGKVRQGNTTHGKERQGQAWQYRASKKSKGEESQSLARKVESR